MTGTHGTHRGAFETGHDCRVAITSCSDGLIETGSIEVSFCEVAGTFISSVELGDTGCLGSFRSLATISIMAGGSAALEEGNETHAAILLGRGKGRIGWLLVVFGSLQEVQSLLLGWVIGTFESSWQWHTKLNLCGKPIDCSNFFSKQKFG
jgi:hypothetical protein